MSDSNGKILIHICCAPCAIFPIMSLKEQGYQVNGLFFNPNIHPSSEFDKRKESLTKYQEIMKMKIEYVDVCDVSTWRKFDNTDDRCDYCYRLRLEYLFEYASRNGYKLVTTSLLVSPYQKHEFIRKIGEELSEKYDIKFFYQDFRVGFWEGRTIAKSLGLYLQKYCGCIISRELREIELFKKGKTLDD